MKEHSIISFNKVLSIILYILAGLSFLILIKTEARKWFVLGGKSSPANTMIFWMSLGSTIFLSWAGNKLMPKKESNKDNHSNVSNSSVLIDDELLGVENKYSLLIIDDNTKLTSYLNDKVELHLKDKIDTIYIAHDSNQAIERLRSLNWKIDIISTDINHPGVNGITFCKKLRDKYPSIKILIVTSSPHLINESEKYFDSIIKKPFKFSEYMNAISKLV